jgi:hypothetical protein
VDEEGLAAGHSFVEGIDLSGLPLHRPRFLTTEQPFTPEAAVDQSVIVGSDIISFTSGVTAERREAITNSALLAQLVATKQVPDSADIAAWYDAYFDVLTRLGWVLQDRGFSTFEPSSQQADVAVAILDIAAALLGGPATIAYRAVKATLDGLRRMHENSPWITLFERESHHANTARFQIGLAHRAETGDFLVTLMAFSLEARSSFSQVLFFKFRQEAATLKHYSASVSLNEHVLTGIASAVKEKVAAFSQGYIRSLPSL